MTDRYYPISFVKDDAQKWASTYQLGNKMETKARSKYPPGYAGHEHGAKRKFGYACPAPDALPNGIVHIEEMKPSLFETVENDTYHKQYRTIPLPMRSSFGMELREKTHEELKRESIRQVEDAKPAPEDSTFAFSNGAKPTEQTDPWTGRPSVLGEEHEHRESHLKRTSSFVCRHTSDHTHHVHDATGKVTISMDEPYTVAHRGTGTGFKGNNLDTSVFVARPLMRSDSVSFGIPIKPNYTSSYHGVFNTNTAKYYNPNRRGLEYFRFTRSTSTPNLAN